MHYKSLILFLGSVLLLSACNPAKKMNSGALKERSASYILKRLDKQTFDADWLSGKSKISIDYDGQSISATLNLRMQKDKVIWAQVKKLNFEVGRLLITPDSVQLIDRFNRRFFAADVQEFAQFTSAPIDFQMLQNLIFGQPYFWSRENISSSVVNQKYNLEQEGNRIESKYGIDGFTYLLSEQMHQLQEYDVDISASQSDYQSGELSNFPYFRSYSVKGPTNIDLDLNFTKVVLNEAQEFPFSIPAHYSPISR